MTHPAKHKYRCDRCGRARYAEELTFSKHTRRHFCRDWPKCDSLYRRRLHEEPHVQGTA